MPAAHRRFFAALILTVAACAAYWNSLPAPFVFDDHKAILENTALRPGSSLADVLFPPASGASVSGRPVVNLTFAANYRVGGANPFGYHVVNVVIHVLAGLTLYGLIARTLMSQAGRRANTAAPTPNAPLSRTSRRRRLLTNDPVSEDGLADGFALLVALCWLLHPLQTAAVTYVVQRAESLMGLFYLLTLYAFVRAVGGFRGATATEKDGEPEASRAWLAVSVTACLLGMATKEVMASAPVIVLLYDRTFVAGRFRAAWSLRRRYYLALGSTWVLLAMLVWSAQGRGGTAGFGAGISWWKYLLTQSEALALYLRLTFWPAPLVFDRGEYLAPGVGAVLPQIGVVALLLGITAYALWRRPKLGFFGACFFVVLAPTSSVVPIASQTIAEHRMYLPLAAVLSAFAWGLRALIGARLTLALLSVAAAVGAGLTIARNHVYRDAASLWAHTARHAPDNPRAQANLGNALLEAGRNDEAVAAFEAATRLQPDSAEIHLNACHAYTKLGRLAEAVEHGAAAVRLAPDHPDARVNLAAALAQAGREDEAAAQFSAALQLRPGDGAVAEALANVLVQQGQRLARGGRLREAAEKAAQALHAKPDFAEALFLRGNLAAAAEDFAGATAAYQQVLAIAPEHLGARNNLANVSLVTGRIDDAIAAYRELLRLRPGDRSVEENLQRALEVQRRSGR